MENLATHTFVLLNVCLCLHIQKRFFVYDNLQIWKKIIRLDALVSMRNMSMRAIPRHVVSILLGEKYILIHCLLKMREKILLFSLYVSFFRTSPLKVNHDVIWRFMTSQYTTLRKCVIHVNGSPTCRLFNLVANWSIDKWLLSHGQRCTLSNLHIYEY